MYGLKFCFVDFYRMMTPGSATKVLLTRIEPRYDKTNKVSVRPVKTQISLGIRPVRSESSQSAWRNIRSLATHWAHSEDSDQTGRMPRLIWVFAGLNHFVDFVMSWLICFVFCGISALNLNVTWTFKNFQEKAIIKTFKYPNHHLKDKIKALVRQGFLGKMYFTRNGTDFRENVFYKKWPMLQ